MDNFAPDNLPTGDIMLTHVNAHQPPWDADRKGPDETGETIATRLDVAGWTDVHPTFTSNLSVGVCSGRRLLQPISGEAVPVEHRPRHGQRPTPMLLEIRTGQSTPGRIRKTKWPFRKAAWLAFQEACETALSEAESEHEPVQMANRFHSVFHRARVEHIPREREPTPSEALDQELEEAMEDRRTARRTMRNRGHQAKER